jgi:hypothetical protein
MKDAKGEQREMLTRVSVSLLRPSVACRTMVGSHFPSLTSILIICQYILAGWMDVMRSGGP